MDINLQGVTILPRRSRPDEGTIKISALDPGAGKYLEDVIDGTSIILVDPAHIGVNPSILGPSGNSDVHINTNTPSKVEHVIDLNNNKETIFFKDSLNNEILKADYYYTNMIGSALIDRVEIEDYKRNVKVIQQYNYTPDYLNYNISKTETPLP